MKLVGIAIFACLCGVALLACSRSNNLLLGRIEGTVGSHKAVVTDCYRTHMPSPERLDDTADGKAVYRFVPCRDAEIVLRGAELSVNGKAYGPLKDEDTITVDHGKVLINEREAILVSNH
jgi:hypothetical protein